MRLAILGSTRGTNMLALVDAINSFRLPASIELVFSNKKEALLLERAKSFGLNTDFIDSQGLNRDQYDALINEKLINHRIDLVVLIGYMRILSESFVNVWKNKIINVHPSLLPAFAGKMDMEVHKAVLESRVEETGCTVHYVTAELDAGPIVVQKKCKVLSTDTAESLKKRVQELEGEALIEAISNYL